MPEFHPVPEVLPEPPPIIAIATNSHTMAIGVDGTLWSTGSNITGQLGDGTTLIRTFFDQVGIDTNWISMDTGNNHTVAVKADGTLWAWGHYPRTWFTGLGNGTTYGSSIPIQIGTDADWARVAAGHMHTLAIKMDGSLWGWGSNQHGQLGNGMCGTPDTVILEPVQIGTDTDWAYVFAESARTTAIRTNGTLWLWGNNDHELFVAGAESRISTPVQIGTDTDWVSVSLSSQHAVALKKNGTIWSWGNNWNSQLGDGTTASSSIPMQIGTDANWTSVAAGFGFTVATREDGSLWMWGSNTVIPIRVEDRVGDRTDTRLPRQILPGEQWVKVAAGSDRAFAVAQCGRVQRLGNQWTPSP